MLLDLCSDSLEELVLDTNINNPIKSGVVDEDGAFNTLISITVAGG